MNPLWKLGYRRQVIRGIMDLRPFYQQIHLGAGVWTRPWNRETLSQWIRCERGDRKLNRFILPMLPIPLEGATILEIGANAGGNLLWAKRHGARVAIGMEADHRYAEQARFVWTFGGMPTGHWVLQRDVVMCSIPTWSECPPYDMAWLLNVIYHIPAEQRVPVVQRVARVARFLVFQGNGIGDESDGRGWSSLMRLIDQAGLQVYSAMCVPHVRGLVVVVKGLV